MRSSPPAMESAAEGEDLTTGGDQMEIVRRPADPDEIIPTQTIGHDPNIFRDEYTRTIAPTDKRTPAEDQGGGEGGSDLRTQRPDAHVH